MLVAGGVDEAVSVAGGGDDSGTNAISINFADCGCATVDAMTYCVNFGFTAKTERILGVGANICGDGELI